MSRHSVTITLGIAEIKIYEAQKPNQNAAFPACLVLLHTDIYETRSEGGQDSSCVLTYHLTSDQPDDEATITLACEFFV